MSIFFRPASEVLRGIEFLDDGFVLIVDSNGNTQKSNFKMEVDRGVTGSPPVSLSLVRINSDEGHATKVGGEKIFFSFVELGLKRGDHFFIRNSFSPFCESDAIQELAAWRNIMPSPIGMSKNIVVKGKIRVQSDATPIRLQRLLSPKEELRLSITIERDADETELSKLKEFQYSTPDEGFSSVILLMQDASEKKCVIGLASQHVVKHMTAGSSEN